MKTLITGGAGFIGSAVIRRTLDDETRYQLTPAGITAKSKATMRFLERKQTEYERLAAEIEQLRQEVQTHVE